MPRNGTPPAASTAVWQGDGVTRESYRYLPGPRMALAAHFHDGYQVCFSPDEDGAYRYRGGSRDAPRGTLFVVHPGEVHATLAPAERTRPAHYQVLYLAPGLLGAARRAPGDGAEPPRFIAPEPLRDRALVAAFLALAGRCGDLAAPLERDAALHAFTERLCQAAGSPGAPRAARSSEAVLGRVRDYLHAHYRAPVRLDELAELAGCSAYHLTESFRLRFGLPPHAYQTAVRVSHAKRLLGRGAAPSSVAADTGFFDQSHLGRHFKRLVGVTPARYAADPRNVLYADSRACHPSGQDAHPTTSTKGSAYERDDEPRRRA